MITSDCYCDAYGNRCTLHDEMNELIDMWDEFKLDFAIQRWKEVKLITNDELETIIETLILEEEINND
mgnify:CR=1 FL=1